MLSDNVLFFQDDTSGDYRNAIMALVIGGPPPQMAAKCEYHVLGHHSVTLGQTCLSALCFTSPAIRMESDIRKSVSCLII